MALVQALRPSQVQPAARGSDPGDDGTAGTAATGVYPRYPRDRSAAGFGCHRPYCHHRSAHQTVHPDGGPGSGGRTGAGDRDGTGIYGKRTRALAVPMAELGCLPYQDYQTGSHRCRTHRTTAQLPVRRVAQRTPGPAASPGAAGPRDPRSGGGIIHPDLAPACPATAPGKCGPALVHYHELSEFYYRGGCAHGDPGNRTADRLRAGPGRPAAHGAHAVAG